MEEDKTAGMESEGGADAEFVVSRVIDAPRDMVWEAWKDPERIKQWFGPQGFTAPVIENDFRVGGRYLYDMRDSEGKDYWSTGEYLEIVKPERIVATDSFADEQGNVVPASHYGLPGDFPLERPVTTTFEEVEGNKTRLTIRHKAAGATDEDERTGWNETLDKLEENLRMSKAA